MENSTFLDLRKSAIYFAIWLGAITLLVLTSSFTKITPENFSEDTNAPTDYEVLRKCTVVNADRCDAGGNSYGNFWWPDAVNGHASGFFASNGENGLMFQEFNNGTASITGYTKLGDCIAEIYVVLKDKKDWNTWSAGGGQFKSEGCSQAVANDLHYYVIDGEKSYVTSYGTDCMEEGTYKISQRPDPNDPYTPNYGVHIGPGGALWDSNVGSEGLAGWGWIGPKGDEKRWIFDFNFTIDCPVPDEDNDDDDVPDDVDLDDDDDGILDTVEDPNIDGDDDPFTNALDSDGDGIPNYLDIDSDDDGILDNLEGQASDTYVAPSGIDANGNGLDDAYEGTFGFGIDPINTDAGIGQGNIPDYLDIDSDIDGIRDNIEAQSFTNYIAPSGDDINQNGLDDAYESGSNLGLNPVSSDEDPYPDFRDFDSDGDGIKDKVEAQTSEGFIEPIGDLNKNDIDDAYEAGLDPIDTDGDNVPDYRDIDSDDDGVLDNLEGQSSAGYIPVSGLDFDEDGLDDVYGEGGIVPVNSDSDTNPDFRDIDSDNDGIPDNIEAQTTAGYITPEGADDDQDGLDNAYEGSGDEGITPENTDGGDEPDYRDLDTDNDTVADNNEGNDFNFDGIPDQAFTGTDTDNDGLDDGYEGSDVDDGYDVNDEIEDPATDLPDTDGTEDVNYRDFDDDGDTIDTPDEDIDDDGDPTNDDTDDDGTPDYLDPDRDPDPDTDDDGVPDSVDLDDDNDGILDTTEDPNLDGDDDPLTDPFNSDGDTRPNHLDIDSDNDGIPDNIEAQTTVGYIAPNDDDEATYAANDGVNSAYLGGLDPENTDGSDEPDYLDPDTDNDTVADNNEGNDFNFDGIPDQTFTGTDTDNDGLDDGYEGSDVDDGYDVNDEIEDPATDLPDTDGTEDVNYRDFDDDGDTIDTPDEDIDDDGDPTNDDTDDDGTPDYLDPDNDPDPDTDDDGVPDSVDLDDDNDGILDTTEDPNLDGDNDPLTDPLDSDGDTRPNHLDIDSDNDGIPDNIEAQTTVGYIAPNDDDEATYAANDGVNSAYLGGLDPENTDGSDEPDYLDLDTDNDTVADNNEGNDFNFDGIPDQTFTGTDTDNDGLDDGYEGSDVDDGYDVNDEIEDPATDLPDTDGTEDVNYRDFDDDGDTIDTPDEDIDDDGDPTNDDTDDDGTPDYLDPTDDRPVTEEPILVTQLVTPNGDGKNEFLWINGVDRIPNNSLKIFNRWGVAIYEGTGYNNQNNVFDGRSKGRSTLSADDYVPAGVYFYIFEYQNNQENITDSGYIYVSK